MKRVFRAISWLLSVALVAGALTLNGASVATAAKTKAPYTAPLSGMEPKIAAQAFSTDYATPVTLHPVYTQDGINLTFCLQEIKSSKCESAAAAPSKSKTYTLPDEGTWEIDQATGELVFYPDVNFSGVTTPVTYGVNDSFGTGFASITVTVGKPAIPTISTTLAATTFDTPITVKPATTGALIAAFTACMVDGTDCVKDFTNEFGDWKINNSDGSVRFTPLSGFSGVATADYQIADSFGQAVQGHIVITVANPAPPILDDASADTAFDTPVSFDVKVQGTNINKGRFCFVDPIDGSCRQGRSLTVFGEGTWSADTSSTSPQITFTPNSKFSGNATPIEVRAFDKFKKFGGKCSNPDTCSAQSGSSIVRVHVAKPTKKIIGKVTNDPNTTAFNTAITLTPTVLGTVDGTDLDFCLVDPTDGDCKSVVEIANKGVWTVNQNKGTVTFDPYSFFSGYTDKIVFYATDSYGRTSDPGTLWVRVLGPNKPNFTFDGGGRVDYGETVTFVPHGNGKWIDYSTACLVDPSTDDCVKTFDVEGKGTWTVNNDGTVTFVPVDGYTGRVDPVLYQATSLFGPPGQCEAHGADPHGRFDNGEFPDESGSGSHQCSSTGEQWLSIEYRAPGNPRVFRKVVTTEFRTPIIFTPKARTAKGVAIDESTACLVDPATSICGSTVTIDGRGTFQLIPGTRAVKFTPVDTFAGVTPPVMYRVADVNGNYGQNWIRVTVNLPGYEVVYHTYKRTPFQTPITFMPEYQAVNPQFATACIIDPADTICRTTVTLDGQGTFVVDQTTGLVTFTPAADFTGVVTPVAYQIVDAFGWQGDGCSGNWTRCYDTTDTCNHLDRGDHNAFYGDDCNRDSKWQHDNDTNNGFQDHTGEYTDFCNPGYGDGDGEDDDNGLDGEHYHHDDADNEHDPYGYKEHLTTVGTVSTTSSVDALHDGSGDHEDGDYDEDENGDEGDDEGSHYCKNLITSWLHVVVEDAGAPYVDPVSEVIPHDTTITVQPQVHTAPGTWFDPASACIVDPADNACKTHVELPGVGVFDVNPLTGEVTFNPEPYFSGQVPKVIYEACDNLGKCGHNFIDIYVQKPEDPPSVPTHKFTPFNTEITFMPNVSGVNLIPGTACIVDPHDSICKWRVVFDEGVYEVDFYTGKLTFYPTTGFIGDAPHVLYQVVDYFGAGADSKCQLQDPYAFMLHHDTDDGTYDDDEGGTYDCFRLVTSDTYVTVLPPDGPVVNPVSKLTPINTEVWLSPVVNGTNIDPTEACLVVYKTQELYQLDGSGNFVLDGNGDKIVIGWEYVLDGNGDRIEISCVRDLTLPGYGRFIVFDDGQVLFIPAYNYIGRVPTVDYRAFDENGRSGQNTLDVEILKPNGPIVDPVDTTTPFNTEKTVQNDVRGADIQYYTACLKTQINGRDACVKELTIDGQGTFYVNDDGSVTFVPEYGFVGPVCQSALNAQGGCDDPVMYQVCDIFAQCGSNYIKIEVLKPELIVYDYEDRTPYKTDWNDPRAGVDKYVGDNGTQYNTLALCEAATTNCVLLPRKYKGSQVDLTSACFITGDGCVTRLEIVGEGVWTINTTTGVATFSPYDVFANAWTRYVHYQLCDGYGTCDDGTIRIWVELPAPPSIDPIDEETPYQTPKEDLTPKWNGPGLPAPETACIVEYAHTVDADTGAWIFTLDGDGNKIRTGCASVLETPEGTWTVDPKDGSVDFEPKDGYVGPAKVEYCIEDLWGQEACNEIKIEVLPPTELDIEDITDYVDVGQNWTGTPKLVDLKDPTGDTGPIDYTTACFAIFNLLGERIACITPRAGDVYAVDEGTWEIDATTGAVTFKPATGFGGWVPKIIYCVKDVYGVNEACGYIHLFINNPDAPTVDELKDETPYDTNWKGLPNATPHGDGTTIDYTTACLEYDGECVRPTSADPLVTPQGKWWIDPVTGEVTFDPDPKFTGETPCMLWRVSDSHGSFADNCIYITVKKPTPPALDPIVKETPWNTETDPLEPKNNTGPDLRDPKTACFVIYQTDADGNLVLDIDGNPIRVDCVTELSTPEGDFKIDPTNGKLKFKPKRKFYGKVPTITYCIKDIFGQEACTTVDITVLEPNGPSILGDHQTIDYRGTTTESFQAPGTKGSNGGEIVSYCFLIDVYDAGSDKTTTECLLTYESEEGTWTISPENGKVIFTAKKGFAGTTESLTVQVKDEFGKTATNTVYVIVTPPVPDVLQGDYVMFYTETSYTFTPTVIGEDTDASVVDRSKSCIIDPSITPTELNPNANCVKYVKTKDGEWTVDAVTGAVTFKPVAGFLGLTSVEYRVYNKWGKQDQAWQNIRVKVPTTSIEGGVWLDLNKNGVWDDGEPGLPQVEVTATPLTGGAAVLQRTTVSRAGVNRVNIAALDVGKAKTDSNGRYVIEVTLGTYKISANLANNKIFMSYDPDGAGNPDWQTNVVAENPEVPATADFGAAGTGGLIGSVVINGTAPVPFAEVLCVWSGFDGILGTADDLNLHRIADANGQFNLEGIPGGEYQCGGTDPTSGKQSAPAKAGVDQYAGHPASVRLPISKLSKYVFTISGFKDGKPQFTKKMIAKLKAELKAHPNAVRASIDGFTEGPTILKVNPKLSLDRARNAAALIKDTDNTIKIVKLRGIQDYQRLNKKVRRVTITLYFY